MTEIRKLSSDRLRNLCIERNWYTKGNNEEYSELLNMAVECDNVKTEKIVEFAQNILIHSETELELSSICFYIADICYSFFAE